MKEKFTLVIRWPDDREERHQVYVGMRTRTAQFVKEFNERVREAHGE